MKVDERTKDLVRGLVDIGYTPRAVARWHSGHRTDRRLTSALWVIGVCSSTGRHISALRAEVERVRQDRRDRRRMTCLDS